MRQFVLLAVSAVLIAAATGGQVYGSILNPSFETGTKSDWTVVKTVATAMSEVAGSYTSTFGSPVYTYLPTHGNWLFYADAGNAGLGLSSLTTLSQYFHVADNSSFTLDVFFWANLSADLATVTLNGSTLWSKSATTAVWETVASPVLSEGYYTLMITVSNEGLFPSVVGVDNVVLTEPPPVTTVPEPCTLAIWSLLGGVGVVGARRRRKAA